MDSDKSVAMEARARPENELELKKGHELNKALSREARLREGHEDKQID